MNAHSNDSFRFKAPLPNGAQQLSSSAFERKQPQQRSEERYNPNVRKPRKEKRQGRDRNSWARACREWTGR